MTLKRTTMRKVSKKRAAKRASKDGQDALRYMGLVKTLPCAHCGKYGPSDAHHCYHGRYGTKKASDWDVIPLCKSCHQDGPNAIHKIKRTWLEKYGPDHQHIEPTAKRIYEIFGVKRPDTEL